MHDWLVIAADRTGAGRGVSGLTLVKFLQTYFGRRNVAFVPPKRCQEPFSARKALSADTICLGLPSSLEPADIARMRCRRLVAFDYLDRHELAWTPEQAAALRERMQAYLKPWRESAWNYDLQMGLLPIRRYRRLSVALRVDRARRRLPHRLWPKLHDVAFVGRPNPVLLYLNGQVVPVEQRVEWLLALRCETPDLSLWGGLVNLHDNAKHRDQLVARYGDLHCIEHNAEKVNFTSYFYHLCRSRVVLAPGGNVPWSYRHYEALYSRVVVVTIDFRNRDMLVPLPNEGMVHVPDGESVLPAVREALAWSSQRPYLGEQNVAHLERYLRYGQYSRSRPELMERFLAQIG